jgi:hypothetical protein
MMLFWSIQDARVVQKILGGMPVIKLICVAWQSELHFGWHVSRLPIYNSSVRLRLSHVTATELRNARELRNTALIPDFHDRNPLSTVLLAITGGADAASSQFVE